jgi:hypothetical protein
MVCRRGSLNDVPRRRQFEAWAAANHLDPASYEANYGFVRHELEGQYAGFTNRLRQTRSLEESSRLTHSDYETPADVLNGTFASGGARLRYARQALAAGGGAPPVNLAAVPGAGAQMADASGGDTSHEVTVRFVDAPAGPRTGITRADGDARLSLRTNYALSAPF